MREGETVHVEIPVRTLEMVAAGAALGFLSGLFGVGGSSIATPLLRLLGVDRLIALATPLLVTFPTALVAAATYWRSGKVNRRAVEWTVLGGIPSVIAGSYLTALVPARMLMLLTGLFAAGVGLRLLLTQPSHPDAAVEALVPRRLLAVGAVVGFLSGLLANGGGFLLVPAYLLMFHMEAQEAAGTSLVAVALLSLPGVLVHWRLGHMDPQLAGLMTLGILPGTHLGARCALKLKGEHARTLFGWFLLLFGTYFFGRTLYRAEISGLGE